MSKVNVVNESQHITLFEDIDRIINASRIEEMQELKKLVRFVDHLIQTLIHQILNGLLSDRGAKLKILQCIQVIQHCQIMNHPTIKSRLEKLKQVFENNYKQPFDKDLSILRPKIIVLSSASIHSYVENIRDSQNDPIYAEAPRTLVDIASHPTPIQKEPKIKPKQKKEINQQNIETFYLSNLFFTSKKRDKIMELASRSLADKTNIKQKRIHQFSEIHQSYHRQITETA